MIINIIILGFITAMGYWWGRQGLFSALLHLLVTIAAGALALALWEPLVLGWLQGRMPDFAWGVGLLGPFVLLLIVLRTVMDKLVPANVYFSTLVNWIGGTACGLLAGILTAGLTIIGIGFLALPSELAGYEPYVVSGDGQVVANAGGDLWLPVDRRAAGFFNMLSGGAFFSGAPMAVFQPDLANQAVLYRMGYDPNSSVSAAPEAVMVVNAGVFASPLKSVDDNVVKLIGDQARLAGNSIVVVDTKWTIWGGTFDGDSILRLYPTQVRLLSVAAVEASGADAEPMLHAPVGVSRLDPVSHQRTYYSLRDARTYGWADQRGATLGWVFAIPANRTARSLFVRHLRLNLPGEPKILATEANALLGQIEPPPQAAVAAPPTGSTGSTGPTPGGTAVIPGSQQGRNPGAGASLLEITSALPLPISMNMASALSYEGDQIKSGKANVSPATGFVPKGVRAEKIYCYATQTIVRMQIDPQQAQSLLGSTQVAAASLGGITIDDNAGSHYEPFGYIWINNEQKQDISINRDQPIKSSRELPIRQMGPADKLYLYFAVPHNVHLSRISIGQATQEINLDVP